jgi:hypothetical protein
MSTGLMAVPSSKMENATIFSSPLAVDALQLALFIKNFGVSVFSASVLNATLSSNGKNDVSNLMRLVAGMPMVSQPTYTLFQLAVTNSHDRNSKNKRI